MLLNAFSLNMVSSPCVVKVRPATLDEAREAAVDSAVGHADTAAVFASVLGVPVACARRTVTLAGGESAVVGQYRGPRLPEGATALPEGAAIDWIHVAVEAVKAAPAGETTVEYSDQRGSRGRAAYLLLVASDGTIHRFRGEAIPGVCRPQEIGGERNGKWSYTLWRVRLAPGVHVAYQGHSGWERGTLAEACKVTTWAELAEKWGCAESVCRAWCAVNAENTAKELDAAEAPI